MTLDKLLRPCDAWKALGYESKTTFYRHIKNGTITPEYVGQGRGRRIKMSSLPCVAS
jgi:hypothetical protein